MKKTVTIEFEERDYEILRRHLNDEESPCLTKCKYMDQSSCCGCPDHRNWAKKRSEVEEAGLVDVLTELQEYYRKIEQIKKLQNEMKDQKEKILEYGINADNLRLLGLETDEG